MELVPILSTIILVGTIATFILAVAAYILYKIRERRAREESRPAMYAQPEPHVLVAPQVAASLQAPSEAALYAPSRTQVIVNPNLQQQQQPAQRSQNSLFWEYTDEGFVPVNTQEEQASREPVRQPAPQQQQAQDEGYAWL
jgi:hypothetical protein